MSCKKYEEICLIEKNAWLSWHLTFFSDVQPGIGFNSNCMLWSSSIYYGSLGWCAVQLLICLFMHEIRFGINQLKVNHLNACNWCTPSFFSQHFLSLVYIWIHHIVVSALMVTVFKIGFSWSSFFHREVFFIKKMKMAGDSESGR